MMDELNSDRQPSKWFSDEDVWYQIGERFSDLSDAIFLTRFETKEQAVGLPSQDASGRTCLAPNRVNWYDTETGVQHRAWLQIAYDHDRPIDDWQELRAEANRISVELKNLITSRAATPRFALLWGRFSEIGAIFENAWLPDRTVPPHLKGSAKQGIKAQKVWYSKVYVQFEQAGATRAKTEGKVVEFIQEIIERGHYPDSHFGRDCFE